MFEWPPLEKDALTELINMGMGQAANALSNLVRDEVLLTAPELLFVDSHQAATILQEDPDHHVIGVSQRFSGPFSGTASLIFPHVNSLDIIKLIIGDDLPKDLIGQMEQESMMEIGNIILNACLAALANNLEIELDTHLPNYAQGPVAGIIPHDHNQDDVSILCKVLFSIANHNMEGHVFFLIGEDSINKLHKAITHMLEGIG